MHLSGNTAQQHEYKDVDAFNGPHLSLTAFFSFPRPNPGSRTKTTLTLTRWLRGSYGEQGGEVTSRVHQGREREILNQSCELGTESSREWVYGTWLFQEITKREMVTFSIDICLYPVA